VKQFAFRDLRNSLVLFFFIRQTIVDFRPPFVENFRFAGFLPRATAARFSPNHRFPLIPAWPPFLVWKVFQSITGSSLFGTIPPRGRANTHGRFFFSPEGAAGAFVLFFPLNSVQCIPFLPRLVEGASSMRRLICKLTAFPLSSSRRSGLSSLTSLSEVTVAVYLLLSPGVDGGFSLAFF